MAEFYSEEIAKSPRIPKLVEYLFEKNNKRKTMIKQFLFNYKNTLHYLFMLSGINKLTMLKLNW